MQDNLIYRGQGKHNFYQMSSSSVFYPLNKKITLVYFVLVRKMINADAQGFNMFCWCFLSPPSTST